MKNTELESRIRELELRQRIAELEQKIDNIQKRPTATYPSWVYAQTRDRCDAYFKSIKFPDQWYAGATICMQAARTAYKERRKVDGRPERYVYTIEDGEEFFQLFKAFADVYQGYMEHGI